MRGSGRQEGNSKLDSVTLLEPYRGLLHVIEKSFGKVATETIPKIFRGNVIW